MSKKKWTYEACYEEAKKYKTKIEFHKGSSGAYNAAWENGWLDKFDCFVDGRIKWTREACYEVALLCKTRREFQIKYRGAYKAAWKHGWLDDYDWFVDGNKLAGQKKTKYTKEKCREIALGCKTLKEFMTEYPSVYQKARENGWDKEYDWLERQAPIDKRKNDNVYAYFFNEQHAVYVGRSVDASIVNRRSHHRTDKGSTVYKFAKQNNIPIPEMTVLESGLTLNEGLVMEDYYVNKYRKEGWTVLNKAKTGSKSGSLGSMGRGRLTKEKCYELSLDCKSRGEFAKKHPAAYAKARKQGWLEDYKHFVEPFSIIKQRKWPIEKLIEEANKYDTYTDFREHSKRAYDAVKRKRLTQTIRLLFELRA